MVCRHRLPANSPTGWARAAYGFGLTSLGLGYLLAGFATELWHYVLTVGVLGGLAPPRLAWSRPPPCSAAGSRTALAR